MLRGDATTSTTFAADLKKWLQVMETYESGAHMYHTTLPTDALQRLQETMLETEAYGFAKVREERTLPDAIALAQEAGRKYVTIASRVLAGK